MSGASECHGLVSLLLTPGASLPVSSPPHPGPLHLSPPLLSLSFLAFLHISHRFSPAPQYDELPHYPGVVDGPEALAGFSEAAPPTPRASGPYGPHRPPQPPRPGLDSEGLKQEKDEIYG